MGSGNTSVQQGYKPQFDFNPQVNGGGLKIGGNVALGDSTFGGE